MKEREEKIQYRRLEKWLSQDAHNVQTVGSNPTPATNRRSMFHVKHRTRETMFHVKHKEI